MSKFLSWSVHRHIKQLWAKGFGAPSVCGEVKLLLTCFPFTWTVWAEVRIHFDDVEEVAVALLGIESERFPRPSTGLPQK